MKFDGKVSEPTVAVTEIERKSAKLEPISLEQIRRQARENWLQLREQMVIAAKAAGHSKDADRGAKKDHNHSIEDGLDD
jgi:citrate lyase synthetase